MSGPRKNVDDSGFEDGIVFVQDGNGVHHATRARRKPALVEEAEDGEPPTLPDAAPPGWAEPE